MFMRISTKSQKKESINWRKLFSGIGLTKVSEETTKATEEVKKAKEPIRVTIGVAVEKPKAKIISEPSITNREVYPENVTSLELYKNGIATNQQKNIVTDKVTKSTKKDKALKSTKQDIALKGSNIYKVENGGVKKDECKKVKKRGKIRRKLSRVKAQHQLKKDIAMFIIKWTEIMAQSNIYNNTFDTFEIMDEVKTTYGWKFNLIAPIGLSFEDLNKVQKKIEHNFGCNFIFNVSSSNEKAECKIIYERKVKCNSIPFNITKVKPYEICPGLTATGEPYIIDTNATPHILIAGGTRRGKNGATDSILLNWINSCDETELELFLFQCAKVDLIKYKRCRQVKSCIIGDFEAMLDELDYLVNTEMKNRLKKFTKMFETRTGENIADYNKLNPDKKLSYIYVVLDEFLELMMQSSNKCDKEINEVKNGVLTHIQRIGQMGAAVGIQYVVIHQKPEKAYCPTFIKNMSNIRICFGFDDESCGRIVLGDSNGSKVLDLPPRRAYVSVTGAFELIYTSNLTDRRDMFISPQEVDKSQIEANNEKAAEDKISNSIDSEINIAKDDTTIVDNDGSSLLLPSTKTRNLTNKDLKEIDGIQEIDNIVVPEQPLIIEDVKAQDNRENEFEDIEVIQTNEVSSSNQEEKSEEVAKVEEKSEEVAKVGENLEDTEEAKESINKEDTTDNIQELEVKDSKVDIEQWNNALHIVKSQEKEVELQEHEQIDSDALEILNRINSIYEETESEDSLFGGKDNEEEIKGNNSNIDIVDRDTGEHKVDMSEEEEVESEVASENDAKNTTSINTSKISIELIAKEIENDIERLVNSNKANMPTWVPYEPKEGDKVANLDTLRIAQGYKGKARGN